MYHTYTKKENEIESKHNTGEKSPQTLTRARTWSHSHKTLTGQRYSDVQCLTIRLSDVTITTERLENFIF